MAISLITLSKVAGALKAGAVSAAGPAIPVAASLASLPFTEITIGIMLAVGGGLFAFVLSVVDGQEKRAIPWWAHLTLAAGAGFLMMTILANTTFTEWTKAGMLFASGLAARGFLVAVQVLLVDWVRKKGLK